MICLQLEEICGKNNRLNCFDSFIIVLLSFGEACVERIVFWFLRMMRLLCSGFILQMMKWNLLILNGYKLSFRA